MGDLVELAVRGACEPGATRSGSGNPLDSSASLGDAVGMSDDARHTAPPRTGVAEPAGPMTAAQDTVAEHLPPEYREAYLESFARTRADREGTAA